MNQEQIKQALQQLKPVETPTSISTIVVAELLLYLVIAAAICFFIFWLWKKSKQKSSAIKTALSQLKKTNNIYQLNFLLKQVALEFYKQQEIANLSGKSWFDFLNQKQKIFNITDEETLASLYSGNKISTQNINKLKKSIEKWLLLHQKLNK